MKLLTITIPCYNSQDYMEKSICSALTGGDRVEIMIVDDGSSEITHCRLKRSMKKSFLTL